eukprot:scaffold8689_cov18-Prasinocladus_malaysianus.AAC.1
MADTHDTGRYHIILRTNLFLHRLPLLESARSTRALSNGMQKMPSMPSDMPFAHQVYAFTNTLCKVAGDDSFCSHDEHNEDAM